MLRFACPHCAARIETPPGWAGRVTTCPRCKRALDVPDPHAGQGPTTLHQPEPADAAEDVEEPEEVPPERLSRRRRRRRYPRERERWYDSPRRVAAVIAWGVVAGASLVWLVWQFCAAFDGR